MPFQLVKLAGGLLMPIPVALALLVLGLAFLLASRFRWLGVGLVALGIVVLFLVSMPPLPERVLASLESEYPVLSDPPDAEWVVVLGGGSREVTDWPAANRLTRFSLYRLVEGVRLARQLPDAMIVTSGGVSVSGETTAELMAQVAQEWGIEPERIVVQAEPWNTAAEARAVSGRLGSQDRVILVTSAFHMRRAVALFEGQGVDVIPAPTGHYVEPESRYVHVGERLPSAKQVTYMERVLWEGLGLAWAALRGQSD